MQPYYQDEHATIFHGDCVEVMGAMDEASVDSVVCDPPYGLEFMGKEWDRLQPKEGRKDLRGNLKGERTSGGNFGERIGINYGAPRKNPRCRKCGKLQFDHDKSKCRCNAPNFDTRQSEYAFLMQAWHEAWAREALRVLKPGGHLLAFGGTRTFHRLMCAIEDAGFEIRDTMSGEGMFRWYYGSGFPKSMNVSKAIDKMAPREGMFTKFAAHFAKRWQTSGMNRKDFVPHFPHYKNAESVMAQLSNWKLAKNVPSRQDFAILQSLIGLSDDWTTLIERVEAEREVVGKGVSGKTAIWAEDGMGDFDLTAPATDEARQWDGWGTALKPAWEPVVMARKPLSESSVARNVLKHGTGAINVDASRVQGVKPATTRGAGGQHGRYSPLDGQGRIEDDGRGRWPANLLLSHAPECRPTGERRVKGITGGRPGVGGNTGIYGKRKGLERPVIQYADPDGFETIQGWDCAPECSVRAMDEQSGQLGKSSGGNSNAGSGTFTFGQDAARIGKSCGFGDSGGASRFFQTFTPDTGPGFIYQAKASRKDRGEGNTHPTCKPTALMSYLVKLITPPGGVVLDPFAGSGTTLVAARSEGFKAVGVEAEADYCEIAARRLSDSPLTLEVM